ncbi:SAE2-domain-containing protein, partial [Xylariaceae sp. FL0255]
MEHWFTDAGKQILADALSSAYDRAINEFETAYVENSAEVTAELERLRHTASRVQRLEEENVALKAEVAKLRAFSRADSVKPDSTRHSEDNASVRTPLAPRSVNLQSKPKSTSKSSRVDIENLPLSELKAEYSRVDFNRARLQDEYFKSQEALSKSNELLRDRTERCHHWFSHAEKLSDQSQKRLQQIKKLKARLVEVSQAPVDSSFSSDAGLSESTPEPGILARDRPLGSDLIHSRQDAIATPSLPPLPPITISREETIYIKSEPSSDSPVVVSERRLRKRKIATGGEEADIPALTRIKLEHDADSPRGIERHRYNPHESIDFDAEDVREVLTPKKTSRHQHPAERSSAHSHDGAMERLATKNGFPGLEPTEEVHRTSCDEDEDADNVIEPQGLGSFLRGPNTAFQTRMSDPTSSRLPRTGLLKGLLSLAEYDIRGEKQIPSTTKRRDPTSSALEELLNSGRLAQGETRSRHSRPLQKNHYIPTHQDPGRAAKKPREVLNALIDNVNHAPNSKPHSRAMDQVSKSSASSTKTTDISYQSMPSLRLRPRSELQLEDFKINPATNAGYDFAFKDVVRDKVERAAMQGCVKEDCCGRKFRTLARASRSTTGPHEFQSLLESYLGDDCHRLGSMSEAEKEALWIEAKTRELSNASNTHRHRYSPIGTPPGYWETDFPSTQEHEDHNRQVAQMEREMVDERYREAMRPGGRWIFRD